MNVKRTLYFLISVPYRRKFHMFIEKFSADFNVMLSLNSAWLIAFKHYNSMNMNRVFAKF